MTKRRARRRKVFRTEEAEGVVQVAQPVTSEAEQDTLHGGMQIFIKTLTGKTTTLDAEGQ